MGTDTLTYAVSHRTVLRYTAKVSLSYNEVRMRPRDRGSQRTLAFSLLSKPWAVPRSRVDYFGNFVHRVDVTTPHELLEFTVDAVVENTEPRRRRLSEWDQDALAGDPRLEFVLPSPRVPLGENTRSLWHEWNGDDTQLRQRPRDGAAHPAASSVTSAGRPPSNRASTISSQGAPVSARTSRTCSWRWCAAPAGRRDT